MIDIDDDDDVVAIEGYPDVDVSMPPGVAAAFKRLADVASECFMTIDAVSAALPANNRDVVALRDWAASVESPPEPPMEVITARARLRMNQRYERMQRFAAFGVAQDEDAQDEEDRRAMVLAAYAACTAGVPLDEWSPLHGGAQ